MVEAYLDGFNICEKKEILPRVNVIIGVSGYRSITMTDIPFFKNGAILISGSSRQVEFPYEHLDIYKINSEPALVSERLIEEFKVVNDKTFFVIYKGQPINFINGSAFGDTFELVLSGILQCVRYGLENKLQNKLYDLPEVYQEEVANLYYKKKLLHFERKNVEIHKAATAFLLARNKETRKWNILLVDHKKIKKLIPIGGHVEDNEKPEETVIREVLEEAGIKIHLFWNQRVLRWVKNPELFSIQIEEIPTFESNPAHIHEDYMYVGYIHLSSLSKIKIGGKTRLYFQEIDNIIKNRDNYNISNETLQVLHKLILLPFPK